MPGKGIPVNYINLGLEDAKKDSIPPVIARAGIKPVFSSQNVNKNEVRIVELNKCDTSDLIRLPGIGPVLSVRIIKYRNLLGGFCSKEQLREVYGLPTETYEKIKDMVEADTTLIKQLNINSASYRDLLRMPYFERDDINSILKFRDLKGKIDRISELVENNVITMEKAQKVGPYLNFDR